MEDKIIKTKGVHFGLYFGLFLVLLLLYAYVIDNNFFASYWYLGILVLGFFVNGLWVIGDLKKTQNGFITFKEGFTVFFISNALAFLLSTIVTILIFIVIDPDLQATVKEITISKTTEIMENMNAPIDKIDETIEGLKSQNNFSLVAQIKGYFSTLVVASIAGLLLALILKNNKED
ncbi:DUF4199 domain-containing protein [uncultured Polaribacter sp.]|uniref:DUF4199 domain-containing protein n=1 Tax=uncultured Polaribacter sp. TaxID=174711 RepID=UPI00262ADF8D|nr:DUF4199 domain-containing protein [uncultured Polaribacter sp.]